MASRGVRFTVTVLGRTLLTTETILPITDRWLSEVIIITVMQNTPGTSYILHQKTCARSNIIIPPSSLKINISQVNGVFNFKTLTKVN